MSLKLFAALTDHDAERRLCDSGRSPRNFALST